VDYVNQQVQKGGLRQPTHNDFVEQNHRLFRRQWKTAYQFSGQPVTVVVITPIQGLHEFDEHWLCIGIRAHLAERIHKARGLLAEIKGCFFSGHFQGFL
jgi:hypothetical protein